MKKVSYILLLIVSMLYALVVPAQDVSMEGVIKNPPRPPRLVNDYTNTLTAAQINTLEEKLMRLDDTTFTQIVVVIVPTLDGKEVSDAAIELGRSWGVGNKKNNSGVVLLVAKKDRKLNISPGYGLEGALTDVEASGIIEDIIKPNFKGEDFYRGIDEGTDAIIEAVKGEYHTHHARTRGKGGLSAGKIILIILIIIIFLSVSSGGGKGGSFMSRRGSRGFGGPFIWPTGGGSGGSSWGGGSSGGGSFGGFGGGSFGGGGASGSW